MSDSTCPEASAMFWHIRQLLYPMTMQQLTAKASDSSLLPCASHLTIFRSTRTDYRRTLYKIMQEVLDSLYGSNLGCETPHAVYEVASHVLQFEQKLLEWRSKLPVCLSLVQHEDVLNHHDTPITRFRVVLTLRYLNLRILVHRPMLQEYLAGIEKPDFQRHSATLFQIGSSSLAACVHSAVEVVEIASTIICSDSGLRPLLGAWWFCLFYGKAPAYGWLLNHY
jgi:hypothetical protein